MSAEIPVEFFATLRSLSLMQILKIVGIVILVILGVILLLGLIPVSTKGIESQPNPVSSYDEAVARFDAIVEEENPIVNDYGHSILMTHGDKTETAYVLVHGITNSPYQFEELGQMLYDRGRNVLILRMPYHGLKSHDVNELKQLKAEDLVAYADQAVDIANGLGDKVNVLGISGGGTVTGWIAQNRDEVDKALLLSPFLGVAAVPAFLGPFITNLANHIPNITLKSASEEPKDWVYNGESTRGVAAFLRFGKALTQDAKEAAPKASSLSVVTTAVDDTANNDLTAKLVDTWKEEGTDVVTYEFDESFDIPHNSIDPAADPDKKALVYAKILELLGEAPME
jgi:esterase/lipase